MSLLRRIGFGVLGVLAIAVWFTLGPTSADSVPGYERAIEAANSSYEANNVAAESAPQQEVVNGWFNRDMQTILARQNNELLRAGTDRRVPALLLLGLLALCLHGLTSPGQGPAPSSQPWPPGPLPAVGRSAGSWAFPAEEAPARRPAGTPGSSG
jgi:hypothetical protein